MDQPASQPRFTIRFCDECLLPAPHGRIYRTDGEKIEKLPFLVRAQGLLRIQELHAEQPLEPWEMERLTVELTALGLPETEEAWKAATPPNEVKRISEEAHKAKLLLTLASGIPHSERETMIDEVVSSDPAFTQPTIAKIKERALKAPDVSPEQAGDNILKAILLAI